MRLSRFRSLVPVLGLACAGCTSFATVRSAEVRPGPSLTLQGSLTSPPGDDAAWFWSFDCADECDHPISSFDLALAYGSTRATPYTVGAGVNGLVFPYLEGYVQLGRSVTSPYGVGARVGIPVVGWASHQLYGRYDVELGDGQRLLLNPGVFLHAGNSPSGDTPGHFLALVPAVGLLLPGKNASYVPALALGAGVGERRHYAGLGPGERRDLGPGRFTSVFAAVSLNVTLHRSRTEPRTR